MSYTAEISRNNPTCFLFLVDQSGSMAEQFGGEAGRSKAQGVADAINRLLQTLVLRCAKGEYILDRYYIGVIGYGSEIRWGFPIEALAENVLQPVSAIGGNPLRIEERVKRMDDGAGGLIEQRIKFPVWFEPIAQGKTPMCAAFQAAHGLITDFVGQYPSCFPPIVINISDGAANDGHPGPMSDAIRSIASQDGNVLLLNAHVSARGERPILFPTHDGFLPDDFSKLLFYMSSPLPPAMLHQARILEATVEEGARGFAFNADLASVIMFLNIGTRVDNSAS
ncbi:MAG: VWA domain-containing protein [Planctomycetota bacterium]